MHPGAPKHTYSPKAEATSQKIGDRRGRAEYNYIRTRHVRHRTRFFQKIKIFLFFY